MRLMSLRSLLLASGFASVPSLSHANATPNLFDMLGAAGITPVQLVLVVVFLILLFIALSAMYAYIFRRVCRNVSRLPSEFSMAQGTVFFAWAPLLGTIFAGVVSLPLAALSPPSFVSTALNIAITVCGTAELARILLLKLPRSLKSHLQVLAATAVTFAVAGGIFQLLKLLAGAVV